jgi:hypothetical protein
VNNCHAVPTTGLFRWRNEKPGVVTPMERGFKFQLLPMSEGFLIYGTLRGIHDLRYTETGSMWETKGPYCAPMPALKGETRCENVKVPPSCWILQWPVSHISTVGGKTDRWPIFVQVRLSHEVASIQNWRMFVKCTSRGNAAVQISAIYRNLRGCIVTLSGFPLSWRRVDEERPHWQWTCYRT